MTYTFKQLVQMDFVKRADIIANMTEDERKAIILPPSRHQGNGTLKEATTRISTKMRKK